MLAVALPTLTGSNFRLSRPISTPFLPYGSSDGARSAVDVAFRVARRLAAVCGRWRRPVARSGEKSTKTQSDAKTVRDVKVELDETNSDLAEFRR